MKDKNKQKIEIKQDPCLPKNRPNKLTNKKPIKGKNKTNKYII